jgi:hypothetical protein
VGIVKNTISPASQLVFSDVAMSPPTSALSSMLISACAAKTVNNVNNYVIRLVLTGAEGSSITILASALADSNEAGNIATRRPVER